MGQIRSKRQQTFEAENGVIDIADAGPVSEAAVVVHLAAQKIGDEVRLLTQQFRRQPRDLQHFEPQTHCTSP